MREHTDGPWTATKKSSHYQITDLGDFPLAEVYGMSAFGPELCEANARLISAAPDLLAALEEVDAWVEKMPEAMRHRVRLAIGKAVGEDRS